MLANVLAVLLGLGSVTFYMAAFLYPEVHRRSDVIWSGLGLVYAADLWFGAEQIAPIILLGQVVSVALLIGLGWQTLMVRREKTPTYQKTPIVLTPEVVSDWAKDRLNQLRIAPSDTVRPATLKDRPVTGASAERLRQGLNQSSDPRRRPLYDYEFVEDGIVQDSSAPIEGPEIEVFETDHIDPPFAIAEVIAIQLENSIESDSAQAEELDPITTEEPITDDIMAKSTTKEPKTSELTFDLAQSEDSTAESVDKDNWDETVVDSWNDDLEKTDQTASNTVNAKRSRQKPSQKPSLLAMPIILIGWLKDVARSLTQPKPSKPVIEIPRRDSPSTLTEDEAREQAENRFDDDDDWID